MNQKTVLKIINKAAKDGRTELDLSGEKLTTVPAEIGQLKNLTELRLSGNKLTSLPAEFGQLKNLTELSLGSNPIKEPPPEIVEGGIKAIGDYFESLEGEKEGKGNQTADDAGF